MRNVTEPAEREIKLRLSRHAVAALLRHAALVARKAGRARRRKLVSTYFDTANFRLAEADVSNPEEWRTVIPGSDRVYLTGITSYRDYLAISSRVEGLDQLVCERLELVTERANLGEWLDLTERLQRADESV